ncbi:hypothetical protein [Pannonibacter phragmitetus]|uniref:hypothetical protein n=1 Tax=Pannonibacter phragmitetus TaxID=121719 RepID=UPI003D2EC5C2
MSPPCGIVIIDAALFCVFRMSFTKRIAIYTSVPFVEGWLYRLRQTGLALVMFGVALSEAGNPVGVGFGCAFGFQYLSSCGFSACVLLSLVLAVSLFSSS